MDRYMTLTRLFFGFSLSSCSNFPKRKYYYVNIKMNWSDAQRYCREKYTDLVTIESMDDISRLNSPFSYSWAWIGLMDDPKSWKTTGNDTNSWRWSTTGETSKSGFNIWDIGEPDNSKGNESCGMMSRRGRWSDQNCGLLRASVCYTATERNKKTYSYVPELKTWHSAQEYCTHHHTDLAMIENNGENTEAVSAIIPLAEAWIGLYRVPWTWSDKSQNSYRRWQRSSPNNFHGNQFCTAANTAHEWDDDECKFTYVFICHQVSKLKTTVRMTIVTDADLPDPATNTQIFQQLGAVLTNQGWTDFKLQWKIQPRKHENEECKEPQSNSHF